MPVRVLVIVRKWGWCRGWLGIPYPCRKTVEEWRFGLQVTHFLGLGERLGTISGPELDDGR